MRKGDCLRSNINKLLICKRKSRIIGLITITIKTIQTNKNECSTILLGKMVLRCIFEISTSLPINPNKHFIYVPHSAHRLKCYLFHFILFRSAFNCSRCQYPGCPAPIHPPVDSAHTAEAPFGSVYERPSLLANLVKADSISVTRSAYSPTIYRADLIKSQYLVGYIPHT